MHAFICFTTVQFLVQPVEERRIERIELVGARQPQLEHAARVPIGHEQRDGSDEKEPHGFDDAPRGIH